MRQDIASERDTGQKASLVFSKRPSVAIPLVLHMARLCTAWALKCKSPRTICCTYCQAEFTAA